MIKLYQFPPAYDLPNMSPFCMKVEVYLRMADIEYETRPFNPRQAPNGKAPYIQHDGRYITDSSCIIRYLKETFGDPLDADLTPHQRALGHLAQRTLEEHTYWAELYGRWCDDAGWTMIREVLKKVIPAAAQFIALPLIRRGVKKSCHGQGLSRHPPEEIFARAIRDVDAIAELLGANPFLLGDQPTSYDATLYSYLAQFIKTPFDNPLHTHCQQHPTLSAYVDRFAARYWPDAS